MNLKDGVMIVLFSIVVIFALEVFTPINLIGMALAGGSINPGHSLSEIDFSSGSANANLNMNGKAISGVSTIGASGKISAGSFDTIGMLTSNGVNSGGDLITSTNVNAGGYVYSRGAIKNGATDFILDSDNNRPSLTKTLNRALVHDNGDVLVLNYAGDFEGGVRIDSSVTASKFIGSLQGNADSATSANMANQATYSSYADRLEPYATAPYNPCNSFAAGMMYFDTSIPGQTSQLPCICVYWKNVWKWAPFDNWDGACD